MKRTRLRVDEEAQQLYALKENMLFTADSKARNILFSGDCPPKLIACH